VSWSGTSVSRALGALLGMDGADIVLTEQPGAAPRLALSGSESIGFSISHSGRWVACAASLDTKLGLDIEVIDPARDIAALAQQAFDAERIDRLNACPDAQRTDLFYALWCAQEAEIKLGEAGAACFQARHADLAIALCSGRRLERAPPLELQAW
jgi:4'-phosphopantetheinyl transferase